MKLIRILSVILCLIFTACGVGSVSKSAVKRLDNNPIIGTFGTYNKDLISHKFHEIGLPDFKGKIRLTVSAIKFDKSSFKNYNVQFSNQENLKAADSVDISSSYHRIGIGDMVGFVDAINSDSNKSLKDYLEITQNNLVLSEVLIKFPEAVALQLNAASAVYLVNDKTNSYSLEVFSGGNKALRIEFKEGICFGYFFSDLCWKENRKGDPIVAAIISNGSSCPGNTKQDPDKVHSKDIFDKI